MLQTVGGSGSGGIMAGLIFACAWLPTAFLQWRGQKWRQTKSHISGKEGQGRPEIR